MTDSIIDRVTRGNIRWYRRAVGRKYVTEEGGPWDESGLWEVPDTGDGLRIAFRLNLASSAKNEPLIIVRALLQLNDDRLLAELDCEGQFFFEEDGEDPTNDEIRRFAEECGIEYVFGYLRSALADSARLVGLAAPIIPPNQISDLVDDVMASLIDASA
ncbi:hypothetical protein [Williamsia sp.]|uniref:hypothetical protein n=1 Tax=Williamsia sp. TaxID=1872085 RepID=UPI002F94ACAA